MVDDNPWRNRESFDLKSMDINPDDQVYWSRGNVAVELNNALRIWQLVNDILKRSTRLQEIS